MRPLASFSLYIKVETMTKTTAFESLRNHLVMVLGWKEQTGGSRYFDGQETSSFLKNGEVIHVCHQTHPDEEYFKNFEENKDEETVTVNYNHCGRRLFKGTEKKKRGLIIYCDKPECTREPDEDFSQQLKCP